jgi:hypothetical protein
MDRLIALTRDLCLLRAGPQDLPFNAGLFRSLLLLALVVELLTRWWLGVRDGGLVLVPVLAGLLPLPEPGQTPTPMQGLMVWLALGLVIWNLVVDGHILRHTLEVRLFQGVMLALALLLVQFTIALMAAQLLAGAGASGL